MSSAQKRVTPVCKPRKRRVRKKPHRPTDYISVEEWNLLKNLCDDQSRGFLERLVTTMRHFEDEKSVVLTRVCLCKKHLKKKRTKKKEKPEEPTKELPKVPFTTCFSDDGCRMPCGTPYPPLTWKPLRQALAVKYGLRPTSDARGTLSPTLKARQAAAKEHKKFSALIKLLSKHYTYINDTEAQRLYEEEMRRLYAEAEYYMHQIYENPDDLDHPGTWLDPFSAEVGDEYPLSY